MTALHSSYKSGQEGLLQREWRFLQEEIHHSLLRRTGASPTIMLILQGFLSKGVLSEFLKF